MMKVGIRDEAGKVNHDLEGSAALCITISKNEGSEDSWKVGAYFGGAVSPVMATEALKAAVNIVDQGIPHAREALMGNLLMEDIGSLRFGDDEDDDGVDDDAEDDPKG